MDIQLQVNGKPANATFVLPPAGKGPGVLVLHSWWGLNPFFKTLCTQLAEQGFVALAPDLNSGEVARTVDEAEALMKRSDSTLQEDTVLAAKEFLLGHPACTGTKIGVVGFSMGAAWSLIAAAGAPEQVAVTVLFYGVGEADFEKIQSKVIGHFSEVDDWEPIDGIRAMEKEMQSAGVDATIYIYPGLGHWFMEDDRPEYNPEAADLAWERTVAFLKENL